MGEGRMGLGSGSAKGVEEAERGACKTSGETVCQDSR